MFNIQSRRNYDNLIKRIAYNMVIRHKQGIPAQVIYMEYLFQMDKVDRQTEAIIFEALGLFCDYIDNQTISMPLPFSNN